MLGLIWSVCHAVQQREKYVNEAVNKVGPSCPLPGALASQWESFSTVAKDERIWNLFKRIDGIIAPYSDDNPSYLYATKERDTAFQKCKLATNPQLDLNWIRHIYKYRLASADPSDSKEDRWGTSTLNLAGEVPKELPPPGMPFLIKENWPDKYNSLCVVSQNQCSLDPALAQYGVRKAPSCQDNWLPRAHPDTVITPARNSSTLPGGPIAATDNARTD